MKGMLTQLKILIMLLADLLAAYCALVLMVLLRYQGENFDVLFQAHLLPFSIVISLFLLIFYIFNLYSSRFNINITEFMSSFSRSVIVASALSVLLFYIFGEFFKLTPKTNLVIFATLFGLLDFYLRILIRRYFTRNNISRKIALVSEDSNPLLQELRQNQNIGYEIVREFKKFNLVELLKVSPDSVVLNIEKNKNLDQVYELMKREVSVYTINNFYEEMLQKVPLEKIKEDDLIYYISRNKSVFNLFKRILDMSLALLLTILFSPIFILAGVLINLTSKGPILLRQQRVSRNGEKFTLYKFRSMVAMSKSGHAEQNGAIWTTNNKDPRITPVGKFLRTTHLDEIPQLINILKGDISFVGPRPERPEFTKELEKNILYYDLRHSVKAGLTGWAQVNYKYGSSIEEAREKLKYDFYYIKNRTFFFDILILLKTIAKVFFY